MSTRQLWSTQRSFASLLTLARNSYRSRHHFYRNNHCSWRNISVTDCRDTSTVTASVNAIESRPRNGKNDDHSQEHRFKIRPTIESIGPLINPSSLSDTLHAHQKANREGLARDGVLVKRSKESRRLSRPKSPQHNSRREIDVLHLHVESAAKDTYGGQVPPLLSEWRPVKALPFELQFPWTSGDVMKSENNSATAMQLLEAEIQACDGYFSPTPLERAAAAQAYRDIKRHIRYNLDADADADVTLIGSRAAGTESPISDLDVNVALPDESSESGLSRLARKMSRSRFENTILIHAHLKRARVPIIIGTHVPSGLEFQIQSTSSSYDSLEVSKAFIAEYPVARVLFQIIKQLLLMRGLNKGVSGGLTSYPLLNMIIASLKLNDTRYSADNILAAPQLLAFLKFWSSFNFDKEKITFISNSSTIDPISTIPQVLPKTGKSTSNSCTMSLQDPADPANDLGRNTYGIQNVQACFIEARTRLEHALQKSEIVTSEGRRGSGLDDRKQPLLAWCLGGDYTSFEEARYQLQSYSQRNLNETGSHQ